MKYLYTFVTSLFTLSVFAQPETVIERIELEEGKFVIESGMTYPGGEPLRVEISLPEMIDPGSPTVRRFAVPVILSAPFRAYKSLRPVERTEYAGELSATVTELAEQDAELFMEVEVAIDRNIINRRQEYLLIPELKNGGNTLTGPGLLVSGWGKAQLNRRRTKFGNPKLADYFPDSLPEMKITITKYDENLIRYTLRMPYEIWMDEAVVNLHQVVGSSAGKEQLYTIAGAGRVKLQPYEPYAVAPQVTYITPEQEEKRGKRQGRAYLNFQVGRSVILPNFRNNPEELAKVNSAVEELKNNPDVEITGLYIEGYASPEGAYATNEKLSRERSEALKEYIKERFSFTEAMFRVSYIAEDWDGVVQAIRETEMDFKEETLRIIETVDVFDGRETALMKLAGGHVWRRMVKDIFPSLRRVEYQIDYTVRGYNLEESSSLLARSPETLSLRELYLLAENFGKGTQEYDRILLEVIPRYYPDHPVACHNTAARLIELGEYTTALRYLEKAGNTPSSANNRGVIYLISGEPKRAEGLFQQALDAGIPEAIHNLKETRLKTEDNEKLAKRHRQ